MSETNTTISLGSCPTCGGPAQFIGGPGQQLSVRHVDLRADGPCLNQAEIYEALREICQRIERCGASPELTHAVTLASDLAGAIGNKWNPPDKYAADRVRSALLKAADDKDFEQWGPSA